MRASCLKCKAHREVDNSTDLENAQLYCSVCGHFFWFQYVLPEAVVVLSCNKQYCDIEAVKFVDIESNELEHNVITFECPDCYQQHKSLILG